MNMFQSPSSLHTQVDPWALRDYLVSMNFNFSIAFWFFEDSGTTLHTSCLRSGTLWVPFNENKIQMIQFLCSSCSLLFRWSSFSTFQLPDMPQVYIGISEPKWKLCGFKLTHQFQVCIFSQPCQNPLSSI